MSSLAQLELERAGFPSATRHLVFAVPVEQLAGDAAEFDLTVRVDGVDGEAAMSVGYLPGGPVTAGQQRIKDGETRTLRKQLAKPGGVLVVALSQPARVDVSVAGARGFDEDAQLEALAGEDTVEEMPLGADDKVVQAIGAAAAEQADRAAVMNGTLQRLEKLYATAQRERSASFLIATGKSVDEQLKSCRNNIDYLAGPGFARVVAGELKLTSGNPDAPAWLELANDVGKSLQAIAGDVEKWDLGGVVSDAAPRVAQTMQDAAKEGVSLIHWAVVGLGLWLLIKVAP